MEQEEAPEKEEKPRPELPLEFCPACAARLESRHCKMVCPRCGYFMSCSEFE
jgi:hypothetical protein